MLANRHCLHQALGLLDRLGDAQYASPRGAWSPVGAQLRHVIEHYQCFLEGLPEGRVDYDARRRDSALERSRHHARAAVIELDQALAGLVVPLERSLEVQMRCSADDPVASWSRSSVGRELQFLVSHSVHHFALIKLLIVGDGIELPEEFGLAPSTLAHLRPR